MSETPTCRGRSAVWRTHNPQLMLPETIVITACLAYFFIRPSRRGWRRPTNFPTPTDRRLGTGTRASRAGNLSGEIRRRKKKVGKAFLRSDRHRKFIHHVSGARVCHFLSHDNSIQMPGKYLTSMKLAWIEWVGGTKGLTNFLRK